MSNDTATVNMSAESWMRAGSRFMLVMKNKSGVWVRLDSCPKERGSVELCKKMRKEPRGYEYAVIDPNGWTVETRNAV